MAEVLGVVASSAGIASLGLQIIENVEKLVDFFSRVHDAPNEVKFILEEVTILGNILVECSRHQPSLGSNESTSKARAQAILHCETASKYLSAIVTELEAGMRVSKWQSKWHSILTALKGKKLAALMAKLERAKSTLALAQMLYLQSLHSKCIDQIELSSPSSITHAQNQSQSRSVSGRNAKKDANTCSFRSETMYHFGIGTLVVRMKKDPKMIHPRPSVEEDQIQYHLSLWLINRGITITTTREFGTLQATLRPYHFVSCDSPIFRACASGNDDAIRHLIDTRQASPFDTTYSGLTPLHVAAAWLRPNTCKLLLDMGADCSVPVYYRDISWTPLSLATECAGDHRVFLFDGLEDARAKRQERLPCMRETMRVLLDHGECEIQQGYVPGEAGRWNYSKSALHYFRGSPEDYLWLAQKENIYVPKDDQDDFQASIVLQQTWMFPNDSFTAALSTVSDIAHLATFRDSDGRTLLHNLFSSNWGPEAGIWMNGDDVFGTIQKLLDNGADVHACDISGRSPLMYAAQQSLMFLQSKGLEWSAKTAPAAYSNFLKRWVTLLESSGIKPREYALREKELGAEETVPCNTFNEYSNPCISKWSWYVRVRFNHGQASDELQIEFEYSCKEKPLMPGGWVG